MHKSTPEIPQAKSMSSFASHPTKLTPKQLKVSRHTTDNSSQAAIHTVRQAQHPAHPSAWTLSAQTGSQHKGTVQEKQHQHVQA